MVPPGPASAATVDLQAPGSLSAARAVGAIVMQGNFPPPILEVQLALRRFGNGGLDTEFAIIGSVDAGSGIGTSSFRFPRWKEMMNYESLLLSVLRFYCVTICISNSVPESEIKKAVLVGRRTVVPDIWTEAARSIEIDSR